MTFTLEPAAPFACELNRSLIKASFDIANDWFFYDGAFSGVSILEQALSNTWLHENFIALSGERELFAYFEGQWSRPMDVITGFRVINFNKDKSRMFVRDYCGHKVGVRHYAQKNYTGKISDINLYELTREEYFEWKGRGFSKKR